MEDIEERKKERSLGLLLARVLLEIEKITRHRKVNYC